MKKMIENIKSILGITTKRTEQINCNYSNDYYGDQYCQADKNTVSKVHSSSK